MTNKYANRSRISEAKFRELVKLFALDLTATQMAGLSGLNRNTINRYVTGIRGRIAEYCTVSAPIAGEYPFERGQKIKQKCVGIMERERKMSTLLLDREQALRSSQKVNNGALSDIDLIIDLQEDQHIWKTKGPSGSKKRRIDGFWGYVTTRLEKFKGIHSQSYFLHLKESEFRYNNEKDQLYHLILKIIRNHPLF